MHTHAVESITAPRTVAGAWAGEDLDAAEARARFLITSALAQSSNPFLSTNFRPGAVVLLHVLNDLRPDIPVVWIDTGYNTPATYRYVAAIRETLNLALRVYTPRTTASHWAARHGDIPTPSDNRFATFVEQIKLEPFERALDELQPDLWFTGIREEQTEYRRTLGAVSNGPRGITRVAPLYEWNTALIDAYVRRHKLPDNADYFDPTKPGGKLECGLQQIA